MDSYGNQNIPCPRPISCSCCESAGDNLKPWRFYGDPCPNPIQILAEPCQDLAPGRSAKTNLSGLGRIVEVSAVIRNVCPHRSIAAAVLLTEVDRCGIEHNRGLKTYEIPPQGGDACRDLELKCVRFIVPESTRTWEDCPTLCDERRFRARVMANYLDTDFTCCREETNI